MSDFTVEEFERAQRIFMALSNAFGPGLTEHDKIAFIARHLAKSREMGAALARGSDTDVS